MKKESSKTTTPCVSCGALVEDGAENCSLCGWPVGVEDHDVRDGETARQTEAINETPAQSEGPFCHMCGWKNPAGARFCSSCGTKLQEVEQQEIASKPVQTESEKMPPPSVVNNEVASESSKARVSGLHMTMLIVSSLLIVGALYMITAFSKRAFPPVEEAASQQAAEQGSGTRTLPAETENRLAQLQVEVDALSGEAKKAKQQEIVELYRQNNRPDRAAETWKSIAEESGVASDWFEAGHMYFEWMESQGGELRFAAAQRAVEAYEKGLEIGEDDLNIRSALAMAYLNTRNPMQGVQQIRSVLDQDPDHLQGNYYYGVMLMQINRIEQAASQFQRVKQLVGENHPLFQQADMMLQNLRTLRGAPGS